MIEGKSNHMSSGKFVSRPSPVAEVLLTFSSPQVRAFLNSVNSPISRGHAYTAGLFKACETDNRFS